MGSWIRSFIGWLSKPDAKPVVGNWLKEEFRPMKKYERWSLGVDIAGFVVVVISIWFLYLQTQTQNKALDAQNKALDAQNESLRAQNKSLTSSSYAAVVNEQLQLTSIFIEEPILGSFFLNDGATTDPVDLEALKDDNPNLYYKVIAVADYHLDFFDLFIGQSDYFLKFDDGVFDEEAWESWLRYIKDTFAQSPVLCQRLEQVQNWYTAYYRDFSECSFKSVE